MTNPTYAFKNSKPSIAVIGAGVMGLTCVVELIKSGYRNITIYAENVTPCTTSDVAAATCVTQKSYPEPENTWYQHNLFRLNHLLSVINAGVSKLNYMEVCKKNATNQDVKNASPFLFDDYVCTREKNIFLVNSKKHMKFLMDIITNNKITIHKEKIKNINPLINQYNIIINCSGLGSLDLFNDQTVIPIRGQIVILSRPKELNCCIAELTENLTYIIPRDDDCIVGGTEEISNWDLNPDKQTTHRILDRAQQICPLLKNEKIVDVKVGLRPARNRIRLETERKDNCLIVHNYGHGGEGYSFAWGCAVAIKDILNTEYN